MKQKHRNWLNYTNLAAIFSSIDFVSEADNEISFKIILQRTMERTHEVLHHNLDEQI